MTFMADSGYMTRYENGEGWPNLLAEAEKEVERLRDDWKTEARGARRAEKEVERLRELLRSLYSWVDANEVPPSALADEVEAALDITALPARSRQSGTSDHESTQYIDMRDANTEDR